MHALSPRTPPLRSRHDLLVFAGLPAAEGVFGWIFELRFAVLCGLVMCLGWLPCALTHSIYSIHANQPTHLPLSLPQRIPPPVPNRRARLPEFTHKKPIHVKAMRVKPPRQPHPLPEAPPLKVPHPLRPKAQPRLHQLDIRPPRQRILHHGLVLFDGDAARRVHNIAAGLGRMVHGIDGREEELLLQMWQAEEVGGGFAGFDARVLGDDAGAAAGGVEQDAVEAADEGGEEARVVGGDDGVAGAEAVDVADEGLGAAGVAVVGEDAAGVFHEGGDVGGFAAGGGGHVEDALVGLWGEGDDGEEGGGGLEDVFPREVFGRGAEGDGGFEDLEADFGPGPYGLEDDAAVDEGGGEKAAGGA